MLLVPSITEGKSPDYDLLGDPPLDCVLQAELPSGEIIPVADHRAVVYGDGEVEVVGSEYRILPHRMVFERVHEEISTAWSVAFWQVETAISHKGARARGSWMLGGEDFTFEASGQDWYVVLRVFNSYDSFFGLHYDLAVRSAVHGGMIPFRCLRTKQRKRGADPIGKLCESITEKLNAVEADSCGRFQQELARVASVQLKSENDVQAILDQFTSHWFRKKAQQEIFLKFFAEEQENLLDLLGLIGWYTNSRIPSISRQIMYQQELLYREIAHVAQLD